MNRSPIGEYHISGRFKVGAVAEKAAEVAIRHFEIDDRQTPFALCPELRGVKQNLAYHLPKIINLSNRI
ncbi:hypothetical protein HYZ70_01575 [Candidatus Curtissbacteria bacterium]|nr:hypothetical protein [Candidatus Curtissbacteria bacterium]